MSKNREHRGLIAKETVNILERGFYLNQQKVEIDIRESLQIAIAGSIHYSEANFKQVFSQLNQKQVRVNQNQIQFEINNETTLHAASRLVNQSGFEKESEKPKVLCLNFASAKNPGGGFLNGSQAQEHISCTLRIIS